MGVFDGLFSGLFGAIGSGISAAYQNRIADKQIAAQREENERTREYNLNLAKMQNQWNIEQWNRENEYNLPSNVLQRYEDAGLSPDLLYSEGSGLGVGTSGNSPDMTSGAPASPVDMSALGRKTSTYGAMIAGAFNNALLGTEIKKKSNEADKTGQETKNLVVTNGILSAELLFKAAKEEKTIELMSSQVYVNHATADYTHAQQEKIAYEINQIDAETTRIKKEVGLIQSKIQNVDADTVQKRFDMYLRSRDFEVKCLDIMSQINLRKSQEKLNLQTVKDMVATQAARIYNLNSAAWVNEANGQRALADIGIMSQSADITKYIFDNTKEYIGSLSQMQLVTGYLQGFGSMLNGIGSALSGTGNMKGRSTTINKSYHTQGNVYVAP